MKLVDILARELKAWPEGLECLSQLKGAGYIINGKGFDGRAFDALSIADETRIAGAIVTRAEWQAAVDALKVAEGIADAEAGNLISLDDVKDKWQGKTERAQVLPSGAGHGPKGGVMSDLIEVKTADLIGKPLDWAVAKAAGFEPITGRPACKFVGFYLDNPPDSTPITGFPFSPSTDWAKVGPLLHDYGISVIAPHDDFPDDVDYWAGIGLLVNSSSGTYFEGANSTGKTALIAACRAIVSAKLGDTVQVPKELMP